MQKNNANKMNNKGFTLLEVLVAVVILAVISVPLLRSFATAAQTNRKAKIEARCTTVAENLAEDFRDMKVEDLIDRYTSSGNVITKKTLTVDDAEQEYYTFVLGDLSNISSTLPDDYSAYVSLDSSYYVNANGLNLSQIEPVSVKDCAIYSMKDTSENPSFAGAIVDPEAEVYRVYMDRNTDARAVPGNHYSALTVNDLKSLLKRDITISIDKTGTYDVTTDSGVVTDTIDVVSVNVKIEYILQSSDFMPSSDVRYTYVDSNLYDNSTSHNALNSVYLFYYPRYKVASVGRDDIQVENLENVEANLYIVALDGAADATQRAAFLASGNQKLTIIESPEATQENARLTLRTNMAKDIPYSHKTGADGTLQMRLTYKNNIGSVNKIGTDAQEYVRAAYIDGKTLSRSDTPKRIYKMNVAIYDMNTGDVISAMAVDPGNTTSASGVIPSTTTTSGDIIDLPAVISFDGTKLEY